MLTVRRRLVAGAIVAAACTAAPAAHADPIPGAYIVTTSGDPAAAADRARARGAVVDHVYRHAVRGYAARMSARAAAQTAREPGVASVVQDRSVSIAAPKPKPGGAGQTLPTGVNRVDAELITRAGAPVAVLDTGIDVDHPDLSVAGGVNCSTGSSYDDGNGHGTHVAGTIGARNNSIGVVGVAPATPVYAVRVLNNAGSGSWSSIICGIDWVTARAGTIKIANMSLGGTGSDTGCNDGGLHAAICRSVAAGVTYAVAAGNESDDAARHVPAAYDEVITVSALSDFNGLPGGGAAATCRADVDDTFADFSNYGADVDLIAPGVCINSTWKGGGYSTISGTSMATPHVAGAAALHMASNPSATPAQVKSALQAAGTLDWSNADDRDATKERLLNVAGF